MSGTHPVCSASTPAGAAQPAGSTHPRAVTGQSEVPLVGGKALGDRVRAAYLLQARQDLGVVQMCSHDRLTSLVNRVRMQAETPKQRQDDLLVTM